MTDARLPQGAALIFLGALVAAPAVADEKADLRGADENPPVVTAGSGDFKAKIRADRIEFQLTYDVAADGSDILQSHIHVENPGNNGPIAVFLCTNLGNTPAGATQRNCPPSPDAVSGEIVASDVINAGNLMAGDLEGLKRLIEDGATYVNVHTNAVPSGEVRGQINPRRR